MFKRLLGWGRRPAVEFSGLHHHESLACDDDTFVVSFPRSGNTWLRLLISDAILQSQGYETGTRLPIHQDHIIPDFDPSVLSQVDERIRLNTRLFKTHWHHRPFIKRALFLFRRPTSSLTSYYHFQLRYPERQSRAAAGIDRFCLDTLREWQMHAESYLQAAKRSESEIKFVWYQRLWYQPVSTLQECLDWLGIPTTAEICARAVEHHDFSKLKAKEASPQNGQFFFRKGRLDSGRDELQKATYERITRLSAPVFERLVNAAGGDSGVSRYVA